MKRSLSLAQTDPTRTISRRGFLASAGVTALSAALFPERLLADCGRTSPDILGPYWVENAPYRTVLCDESEPGTRLFITGRVFAADCETPIEGSIVDVWHARNDGCYSVLESCPDEDPFNCRGQMLTNANGDYGYETILPGYYATRPRHVHYLVSPPIGDPFITQLYFEIDPRSAGLPTDLTIPLELIDGEYHGVFDLILNVAASSADDEHSLPTRVKLHRNFPNPFARETTIRYQLRLPARATLEIFRLDGTAVRRLVDAQHGPGFYTVTWDGRNDHGRLVAAGAYLCRLTAGTVTDVQKLLYTR